MEIPNVYLVQGCKSLTKNWYTLNGYFVSFETAKLYYRDVAPKIYPDYDSFRIVQYSNPKVLREKVVQV